MNLKFWSILLSCLLARAQEATVIGCDGRRNSLASVYHMTRGPVAAAPTRSSSIGDHRKPLFLSAFRSADYGSTYTKVNLMPGTTIVVTSFYICPTNKKKVRGKR